MSKTYSEQLIEANRVIPKTAVAYTIRDLANAFQVSQIFWRREIYDGRLRAINLGSSVRVTQRHLEDYLKKHRWGARSRRDAGQAVDSA